jgi:hypothetical protein
VENNPVPQTSERSLAMNRQNLIQNLVARKLQAAGRNSAVCF